MQKLPKKVRPYGLAIHNFRRLSRRLPAELNAYEYFKLIDAQRTAHQNTFGKYFALSVILFVLLSANGVAESIGVKTALVEVSVPTVYLVFFQSIVIGFGLLELLSFQLLSGYRQVASDAVRGRFSDADLLALPTRSDSAWTSLVAPRWSFLVLPKKFNLGQIIALIFIVVPLCSIYGAMYWTQISHIGRYLYSGTNVLMGGFLSAISIMILLAPVAIIAFSALAFSYKKNVSFVRWSFLHVLYRKLGVHPDYRREWLAKEKSSSSPE